MELVERSTGKLVEVPDEMVQRAYASGQYGLPQGAAMPVRTPGGTVGLVSPDQADLAATAGELTASPQQIAAEQLKGQYGGLGGTVAAGLVGAAQGATESTGLPFVPFAQNLGGLLAPSEIRHDPISGQTHTVGGEARTTEALKALAELHPGASMIGQGVGMAGMSALGGGALGALGDLAEQGVARVGGGRIAQMAARGATEVGGWSGVQAVDESALGGDHDLNAEKVIAAIGHGALIGGLAGGAFGLVGEGISKAGQGVRDTVGRFARAVRPADVEGVAEGQFGKAADGLGELYVKASSGISGADPAAVRRLTALDSEGATARRVAVYDADKHLDEAARAIRQAGDSMLSADRLIADEAKGSLKADYVRRAVASGTEEQAGAFARSQVAKVLDGADKFLAEGSPYAKSIESASKVAYRTLEAVGDGADNAATFIALDQFKRDMQRLTRNAYQGALRLADPIDQRAAREAAEWFDDVAKGLRSGLENEDLWGKAAQDQKTINAAWTKQIDASKRFHASLTTEVGRDPANPYLDVRGMDPSKVTSYVRNLTNTDKDLVHQAVRDYIDGTREFADAVRNSYDLPPEKLAEVDKLQRATHAFGREIQRSSEVITLANQYKALRAADNPLGTAATLAGGMLGGPIGAAAGAGIGALANPGRVVAQLAAVERLMGEVDKRMDSGIAKFFQRKPKLLDKPPSVAVLGGTSERDAFEKSVAHVRELVADNEAHAERVGKSIAPIATAAPSTATAVATKAAGMTAYLATNAPTMHTGDTLIVGKEKPLYSDTEMRSWARRAAIVHDPTAIFDSLARGSVTPEEVDALRTQWPGLYREMQGKIMDRLSHEPLTREKRLTLGVLFDVPADTDMTPAAVATFQQAYAATPNAKDAGKVPAPRAHPFNLSLAKGYATITQGARR